VLDGQGYRIVFESAPDGIVIVDEAGLILDANPRTELMFGYRKEELVGRPVEDLIPNSARDAHRRVRGRFSEAPRSRAMGEGLELEGQRHDGSCFPVEISLSPLRTASGAYVVCAVRDVTARRRLRNFSTSTLRAAESERLLLAQELHDDTAQELSALLLKLKVARASTDPEAMGRHLDELREAIQSCADGVRRIARGLRPPALDDVGVVAAIETHARTVAQAADLRVDVEAEQLGEVLGSEAKLVLYRIVQEALSNSVRHADAATVTIQICRRNGRVVAVVDDDGSGFRPEHLASGQGLGLTGMAERASSVGGNVHIESQPGSGTRVVIEIPIAAEEATHG
jgi:PAS domain S-box-containing protein